MLELVDAVPDAVLLLPFAVDARGDVRVEDEGVPGEAPAGPERSMDALEHAAPVGPRRQVEQRTEGDVDQAGRLVQLEVAHVLLAELELDTRRGGALARLLRA